MARIRKLMKNDQESIEPIKKRGRSRKYPLESIEKVDKLTQVTPVERENYTGELNISDHILVKYDKDDSNRIAKILKEKDNSYYIHYQDFDKRLDEWITREKIIEKLDLNNDLKTLSNSSSTSTLINNNLDISKLIVAQPLTRNMKKEIRGSHQHI
jgi:hypothetical protein